MLLNPLCKDVKLFLEIDKTKQDSQGISPLENFQIIRKQLEEYEGEDVMRSVRQVHR